MAKYDLSDEEADLTKTEWLLLGIANELAELNEQIKKIIESRQVRLETEGLVTEKNEDD